MSAKLEQALATKQVFVQKLVSGEVTIHFKDKTVKDITISHRGVIDILSKRGVTAAAIKKSNLKELLRRKIVKVL